MSDLAIRVENLSKQYRIGARQEGYRTLRDQIAHRFKSLFSRNGHGLSVSGQRSSVTPDSDTIWALKDISFEVKQGEVVGVIGRNGAGKSTLLKILSRISEPTKGRAEIYGRVGSLLEVGTGFHPELTGRENIYLNGAILGMRRPEIEIKFDEIVAFAEVERFIDTPVKHYSSGMYLRLAFAVAAHLEPEILLVDEVLAVGDAAFQKKCLGKMGEVANKGRTVLFVSHNMTAISNLCPRSILLGLGRVESIADTESVIQKYMSHLGAQSNSSLDTRTDREGNGRLRFSGLRFQNLDGHDIAVLASGQPVRLVIDYCASGPTHLRNVGVAAIFLDTLGQLLFVAGTGPWGGDFEQVASKGCFICTIPQLLLVEGQYRIDLWASVNGERADYVQQATLFEVQSTNVLGTRRKLVKHKHGTFVMPHSWDLDGSLGSK